MIVSRIKLKNWKNFQNVDVKLKERVFVVGPNASGKSNFLDVFRFLRDIAKPGGGLQKAVVQRGGIKKIRCLAARQDPDVEIEISLSEYGKEEILWRYALGIKQEPRGFRLPYLTFEKVWKRNELILERPDKNDKEDKERLTQTALEQINANKEFRNIATHLSRTVYFHLIPQLLRFPDAFKGVDLPGDPFGKNFLDRISKVNKKTRDAWLRRIERALRIAVPQLNQLQYTTEKGIPHIEAVFSHWRPRAGKQREEQFSDGTLRLIAFLWSLQEGDSLLLLEEPELSLNESIVKTLAGIIYRLQKPRKKQVIVSTHSSDILNDKGISLDEILLLFPSREGTEIVEAYNKKEIKALLATKMPISEAIHPTIRPAKVEQLLIFN